jgi:hypothetical protein
MQAPDWAKRVEALQQGQLDDCGRMAWMLLVKRVSDEGLLY